MKIQFQDPVVVQVVITSYYFVTDCKQGNTFLFILSILSLTTFLKTCPPRPKFVKSQQNIHTCKALVTRDKQSVFINTFLASADKAKNMIYCRTLE